MWIGFIQSAEWLARNRLKINRKRLISPSKKESWQQTAFGLELQLFPGSLACWPTLQILDSPSRHNHMRQFLPVNLSLYIYMHTLFLFSGEACIILVVCELHLTSCVFFKSYFKKWGNSGKLKLLASQFSTAAKYRAESLSVYYNMPPRV